MTDLYFTRFGLLLILIVSTVLGGCPTCPNISSVPNGFTKMTYVSIKDHIENPGRGFITQTSTLSSHYNPLTVNYLDSLRERTGVNMIRRNFVLDTFVSSHIDSNFLQQIKNDLQVLESAGFNIVVRFCYTLQLQPHAPYGDANKYWILEHLKQLSPLVHQHEGVITALDAGFIGTWGEWFYTTYFGDPNKRDYLKHPPHGYSDAVLKDRKEVLMGILNAVPNSIQVLVRYPKLKTSMFDDKPTTYGEVLKHTNKARTCHHNDCFLSSDNDVGTYSDKAKEYPYLHKDSEYCIVGGETCRPTSGPREECPTALKEMAMFHWTFLNQDYNKDVNNKWKKGGCYEEIHRRLGYRLSLTQVILPNTIHPGGTLCYHITINNSGFASPKHMNIYLVLHSKSNGHYYAAELSKYHDTRTWHPGHTTLDGSVHVVKNFPAGSYDTYLAIGDKILHDKSDFYVLLANQHVPVYSSGYNKLNHGIKVDAHHLSDSSSCQNLVSWTPPKHSRYSRVFKGTF
ncbi:hypothetical protein LOTGIDRAFT_162595 [Lottia gigantea]|uniref:DUF4832 domain-containing protein n=1 Tax=Lottia gigantea TaxID=225164 RepID=V4BUD2_LOTGI|nr:hypothetical protein LOTGIDRAFT_162595 [Lottia gigantea]ESO92669.1 hypothetical protein LOTGIDRAFT_162595 [Lottia gigantea]